MKKIDNVWLSESDRFNKIFKSVVYDQFGTITIHSKEIMFEGNKSTKVLRAPFSIKLVYTRFPLFNFILAIGITMGYCIFRHKSPEFTGIVLVADLAVFSILRLQQKWILLEYKGKSKTEQVYLSDGSIRGWKGLFGGTKKLYSTIKESIL